jgi:dihydrofolate reductase
VDFVALGTIAEIRWLNNRLIYKAPRQEKPMRKVIASEFVSLNGVMEAPETWHFPFVDAELQSEINDASVHSLETLLLGRVTYDTFAAFWPLHTQNEFGISDKINSMSKVVVSSTLERAEWNNSSIINGNLAEEISRLKQQPGGNIGIIGSAKLVQSLLAMDLIDEVRLWVHPIVINGGARLFNEGFGSHSMTLLESKTHGTGVVTLLYRPLLASESA